jgi:hypothetical protein
MKSFVFSSLLFLLLGSFVEKRTPITVRDISGKVIGFDDSLPVEGVTVTIKGTRKTSGTQADRIFYIRVHTPEDSILVFSMAGYKTHEVKLTSRNDYDVALEPSGR